MMCECGCGKPAPIAKKNDAWHGYVKGQPMRFIRGHTNRTQDQPLARRFWEKVDKDGPLPDAGACAVFPEITGTQCWEWTGSAKGGDWPYGQLRHKRATHACVRFPHLFQGTNVDNQADRAAKNIARGKKKPVASVKYLPPAQGTVCWHKRDKRWRATYRGKWVGYFHTYEEGRAAIDALMAVKKCGIASGF
jgi:hypothetical protein